MRVVVCETCSELNMTRNNFKGSGFNCNRCFYYTKSHTKNVLPKQGGFGGCKSDSEITYLNGLPPSEGNLSTDRANRPRCACLKSLNHIQIQWFNAFEIKFLLKRRKCVLIWKAPRPKHLSVDCRLKALQELGGASANAQFLPWMFLSRFDQSLGMNTKV